MSISSGSAVLLMRQNIGESVGVNVGVAIDLTSEQFGDEGAKLCYENNPLQPVREIRMAETQKSERYELLKNNLESYILKSCQK